MHFLGLGHEMIAHACGPKKTGGHIEGNRCLPMGIARRGKGNIPQAEQQSAMGHAMKIEHRLGHHQRDAAVSWFDGFNGGTEPGGVRIFADMGAYVGVNHDVRGSVAVRCTRHY